jgi:hypothetical protein
MTSRLLMGAVGVAGAAYGALLLLRLDLADLADAVLWLAAGVVVHDFVLVPATLAALWVAGRLVPPARRGTLAAGFVVLGTLTVLAVPVLGRFGERADNPTVLDRHYLAGWLVVAAVTTIGVAVGTWRPGGRSGGTSARGG